MTSQTDMFPRPCAGRCWTRAGAPFRNAGCSPQGEREGALRVYMWCARKTLTQSRFHPYADISDFSFIQGPGGRALICYNLGRQSEWVKRPCTLASNVYHGSSLTYGLLVRSPTLRNCNYQESGFIQGGIRQYNHFRGRLIV